MSIVGATFHLNSVSYLFPLQQTGVEATTDDQTPRGIFMISY